MLIVESNSFSSVINKQVDRLGHLNRPSGVYEFHARVGFAHYLANSVAGAGPPRTCPAHTLPRPLNGIVMGKFVALLGDPVYRSNVILLLFQKGISELRDFMRNSPLSTFDTTQDGNNTVVTSSRIIVHECAAC